LHGFEEVIFKYKLEEVFVVYVVIMGGGRVGLKLASSLSKAGQDVTLIENDPKVCEEAASNMDALVICGNGTDVKTLEEANIKDTDIFVAATGNDESNLLACILVKDHNPQKIIARVSDPTHENIFRKVGVDSVVSPELTAASYLEKLIIRPKIADLVILGKGNAELLDIPVENPNIMGKTIGELSPTNDYIICAIYKDGDKEITIPQHDMVLEEGFKISILIKTEAIKRVVKMFIQ
jgi:trk system potassium uptake protein TrkA